MKSLPVMLCLLALAACSHDKPPEPQAATPAADVATPFDALKADKQRAQDVQKIVDKQAEEQRKQIDDATQ